MNEGKERKERHARRGKGNIIKERIGEREREREREYERRREKDSSKRITLNTIAT